MKPYKKILIALILTIFVIIAILIILFIFYPNALLIEHKSYESVKCKNGQEIALAKRVIIADPATTQYSSKNGLYYDISDHPEIMGDIVVRSICVTEACCESYICIDCGNNICDKNENSCTCPEDCCAGEGEIVNTENRPKICCEGLTPIKGMIDPKTGECVNDYPIKEAELCSKCGNGICDNKNFENKCNCPQDCID